MNGPCCDCGRDGDQRLPHPPHNFAPFYTRRSPEKGGRQGRPPATSGPPTGARPGAVAATIPPQTTGARSPTCTTRAPIWPASSSRGPTLGATRPSTRHRRTHPERAAAAAAVTAARVLWAPRRRRNAHELRRCAQRQGRTALGWTRSVPRTPGRRRARAGRRGRRAPCAASAGGSSATRARRRASRRAGGRPSWRVMATGQRESHEEARTLLCAWAVTAWAAHTLATGIASVPLAGRQDLQYVYTYIQMQTT